MRRGRLVYFAGLDGSGKTTQAERLVAMRTAEGLPWTYRWVRWEPKLTDPMMKLARRMLRRGSGTGSARPADDAGHRAFVEGKQKIFRRRGLRALWATLVLLEYLPQMMWRLLPSLYGGKTVVCDRYLPDVWIDLSLNFGEGAEGVERLARHPLSRLFPRPDELVLLRIDPRTGYDRKRDGTPLAYLQEREPLYDHLTTLLPSTVIDAEQGLEEVARALDAAVAK